MPNIESLKTKMRAKLLDLVQEHSDIWANIISLKAKLAEKDKEIDRILDKLAEFDDEE